MTVLRHNLVAPALLVAAAAALSAQTPELYASLPYQQSSVLGVGDRDGDGNEDFLVGHNDTGAVDLVSGGTMRSIQTWSNLGGPSGWYGFGFRLGLGDVTGDGVDEFLVSNPEQSAVVNGALASGVGRVTVIDARTYQVLLDVDGEQGGENFGRSFCAADLDGDARAELVVGAPGFDDPAGADWGRAAIYKIEGPANVLTSRKTRQWNGSGVGHFFGFSVCAGDFSGTAAIDLAVGARADQRSCRKRGDGYVTVLEAGLFGGLWVVHPPITGAQHYFGWDIATLPDLDSDGKNELAIGSPIENSVHVYHGATRTLRYSVTTNQGYTMFGEEIAVIPDQDGDAVDDLMIGGPWQYCGNPVPGTVAVVSLRRNGALIRGFSGRGTGSRFGQSVGAADVDGDGTIDYLVGGSGGTEVRAAQPMSLWADQTTLSRAAGGVVPFHVRAGAQYAGHYYVMFGTTSGFQPGLSLGSVHVPLNVDWFTLLNGNAMNAVPFVNFFGVLDGNGEQTASWTAMPQMPVGFDALAMHYAAVIVQPNPLQIVAATNAVPFYTRP